ERVERDYLAGSLPAADYARLRARLAEEAEGAAAELARLREHEQHVAAEGALKDAEAEVLRHLADLRAGAAEGIDAVRAVRERRVHTRASPTAADTRPQPPRNARLQLRRHATTPPAPTPPPGQRPPWARCPRGGRVLAVCRGRG